MDHTTHTHTHTHTQVNTFPGYYKYNNKCCRLKYLTNSIRVSTRRNMTFLSDYMNSYIHHIEREHQEENFYRIFKGIYTLVYVNILKKLTLTGEEG